MFDLIYIAVGLLFVGLTVGLVYLVSALQRN